LMPTKPLTRLPPSIFICKRWVSLHAGRWRDEDHIVLGESRAIVRTAQCLSLVPSLHGSLLYTLCDNSAAGAANAKGRSCVWQLNRVIRQKAAYLLASTIKLLIPWVETKLMPADELSRTV
jgi:hypothetical protein